MALVCPLACVLAGIGCNEDSGRPHLPLEARLLRVFPESIALASAPDVFAPEANALTVIGPDGELDPSSVRWWVDDAAVAVASPTGLVDGLGAGETFVAAIAEDGSWGAATVRVRPRDGGPITIIAHRGFQHLHPENTVVAFERAFALGADAVELDLRLTRDGVPVVMHDEMVDRTTNGSGAVADLTWAEIRTLDACSKFGPGWDPCGVPSFPQALAAAQGRGVLVAQLYGAFPLESIVRLLSDVRAAGMEQHVVFTSFDLGVVRLVRSIDPFVAVGWNTYAAPIPLHLRDLGRVAVLADLRELQANEDAARLTLRLLAESRVDAAAWTVQSQEEGERAVRLGIRHILGDVMLDRAALERAR